MEFFGMWPVVISLLIGGVAGLGINAASERLSVSYYKDKAVFVNNSKK